MVTIDPQAGRPQVEIFPLSSERPQNFVTEILREELDSFKPQGFQYPEIKVPLVESFPAHSLKPEDLIFYNHDLESWKVKPASVKESEKVYRHQKFGKIYKDSEQMVGNKPIWWSKDTAKHGGASQGLSPSTYKLFVELEKEFRWIDDIDASGKVIKGKHKGDVGMNIPLKECNKVK